MMTERSNPQLNDSDLELLSAYLDDQLAPDERSMLEERLRHEPALRAALDELRATVGALRELEPVPPPRSFTLDPATVARRPPLFRWLSLGPALVAVVLAFGFLAFFVSRSGSGTPAAAPAPMAGVESAQQQPSGAPAAPAAAAVPTTAPAAEAAPGITSADRTATEATAAPDTAITLAAPAEQPTAAAGQPPAEAPAAPPGAARPPEQAPTSAPIATTGNAASETFSLATPQPAGQAPPAAPPSATGPFRVIGIGLGALLVVLLGLWALRAAQRGR